MLNLKFNPQYFFLFLLIFGIEIYIALFVRDQFLRPYGGDILVILLMYFFCRSFTQGLPLLPLYLFIFGVLVEISQYFNLYEIIGIENNVLRIILGATFDFQDILCYLAGGGICWIWEKRIHGKQIPL